MLLCVECVCCHVFVNLIIFSLLCIWYFNWFTVVVFFQWHISCCIFSKLFKCRRTIVKKNSISANKTWFAYFLHFIIKSFFSGPAKTITVSWTLFEVGLLAVHTSLADGKRWLSERLLTKMNLNNLSISASSCDQAGWAPAVTLSLPRHRTNFFSELSKPRCNLMRGRFRRVSVWELFTSFSNYTFLKLTIMSAFFSTSVIFVSLLPTPHLCYQLPACALTKGFSHRKNWKIYNIYSYFVL